MKKNKNLLVVLIYSLLTLWLTACEASNTTKPILSAVSPTKLTDTATSYNTIPSSANPTLKSTTAATSGLCAVTALNVTVSWQQTSEDWIMGKVSFVNKSAAACTLQGVPSAQLMDTQGKLLPNIQNDTSEVRPDSNQIIQSKEQFFSVLVLQPGCNKLLLGDNGDFYLQVKLATNAAEFNLPVKKFSGFEDVSCGRKLTLKVGPFEQAQKIGYAFTSTALAEARTQIAKTDATATIEAKTISALPPTSTPTVIPPLPVNTQSCTATNLTAEVKFFNGATGWSIGDIFFINKSLRTCALQGYPILQLVDEKGQPDPQATFSKMQDSSNSNQIVVMPPGKAAALPFESFRCDLGKEAGKRNIQVTLPENVGQLLVYSNSSEHCKNGSNFKFGSFTYARDDWRTFP